MPGNNRRTSSRGHRARARRAPAHDDPHELLGRLDAALARRASLLDEADTDVCRLCNGIGDEVSGLVIDRFGDVLIAQLHEGRMSMTEEQARVLCEHAASRVGSRAVYKKLFVRDRARGHSATAAEHQNPTPWIGDPVSEEFAVSESGVSFLVRPYDGYSVGVFLERRAERRAVRAQAVGRRVLNTFAYTCGFAVCAALGQAAETVSVDVSPKFLEWGRRNFASNDLALDNHRFIRSDVFDYFRRARRQGRRFDMVILDPPSFSRDRHAKGVFVLDECLDELTAQAVELLESAGVLLLCTNHRELTHKRLERAVRAAAGGRGWRLLDKPKLPPDFRGDPDFARSLLVEFG